MLWLAVSSWETYFAAALVATSVAGIALMLRDPPG